MTCWLPRLSVQARIRTVVSTYKLATDIFPTIFLCSLPAAKPDKVEFSCRSGSGAPAPKATGSKVDSETKTRGINLVPDEGIRDEIKYVVKTSKKGIKVAIEYKQEIETEDAVNKTETEFELEFESLIEYTKGQQTQRWGFGNNGVSTEAYDWDTDEIVQVIPLKNWHAIPGIISDAEGVIKYFTATASLDSRNHVAAGTTGTTQFNFTVSEADVGEHITANSMKIDVRILDFPWQRSDSYIALMSSVDSKKKVKMDYDNDALVSGGKSKLTQDVYITFDEEMESLGLEAFGAYRWEDTAEVTSDSETAAEAPPANVMERDGSRRVEEDDATVAPTEEDVEEPVVVEDVFANATGAELDTLTEVVEDVSAKPGAPPQPPVDVNAGSHTTGSGTTIEVVATSPEEQGTDNHQAIAYSFVGESAHSAGEIYWDPEAGIGYGEAPVSAGWASARSFSLATTLFGALLYVAL